MTRQETIDRRVETLARIEQFFDLMTSDTHVDLNEYRMSLRDVLMRAVQDISSAPLPLDDLRAIGDLPRIVQMKKGEIAEQTSRAIAANRVKT